MARPSSILRARSVRPAFAGLLAVALACGFAGATGASATAISASASVSSIPASTGAAGKPVLEARPAGITAAASSCLSSGTDATINAALVGTGAQAVLCPGAVFLLSNSITFTDRKSVV